MTKNQDFKTNPVVSTQKVRSSNLELYRILCMLMIVAHHYVVNSGLTSEGGPLLTDTTSGNSIFLSLFGAWGKTGINCFLMITGYYMCTSKITLRKFLKLMAQVYFYKFLIFAIFLLTGYETISALRIIKLVMPFWRISFDFVSCFILFWLTIPFLNILIQNMNKRQHELLLLLVLGLYTVLGTLLFVRFNYVTWFVVIYFVSSYIRLYPQPEFEKSNLWGWLTLLNILFAVLSILGLHFIFGDRFGMGYQFVSDSNKIFAVSIAVCSFLWFKNLNIKYSKVINSFGAATFGVLLIHANSNAMRTWLWKDTVDCVGHYISLGTGELILYSVAVVLVIFIICNLIDQIRIATLEKWFFNWYDNKLSAKANDFISRIITG